MLPLRAAIALLCICLLATHTSAAYRKCCRNYSRAKIDFESIRGFSIQTVKAMCSLNAIIFHTAGGKVCTDPAQEWVMNYVNRIRIKAEKVHNNSTPAVK